MRIWPSKGRKVSHEVRRAWGLIERHDRRRFVLVAGYGVLIAGLDTIALILLYALTTLLANEPQSGITASILGHGKLSADQRYNEALILLLVTAGLFVLRSGLSAFGLWLTVGATNNAQANLVSRLLFGYARAAHLTRIDRSSSQTLRTISMSIDQVVSGIVGSSVTLVSNAAVMVAVLLGLAARELRSSLSPSPSTSVRSDCSGCGACARPWRAVDRSSRNWPRSATA